MSAASGSLLCGLRSDLSYFQTNTEKRGARNGSPYFSAIASLAITNLRRLRYRVHRSQEKNVAGNSDQQEDACDGEGPEKRASGLHHVAGHNRRGNSSELVAKIQNSAECPNAFLWSDQRRNRPAHWGCRG